MIEMLRDKWLQSSFAPLDLKIRFQEENWNKEHISRHADSIADMFFGMKYIIEVDHEKLYSIHDGLHGWVIPKAFLTQFGYPHRDLGDHTLVTTMRGEYTNDENIFEHNEFGKDATFVATNNDSDATILALKYK